MEVPLLTEKDMSMPSQARRTASAPKPHPFITWILMALSSIAAFVLPNFSVDPIEGAKPLRFVLPTIALGLIGSAFAIVQGRRLWALVSGVWGFFMLVVLFAVAVIVEWITGGPHL